MWKSPHSAYQMFQCCDQLIQKTTGVRSIGQAYSEFYESLLLDNKKTDNVPVDCVLYQLIITVWIFFKKCQNTAEWFVILFGHDNQEVNGRNIVFMLQTNPPGMRTWMHVIDSAPWRCQVELYSFFVQRCVLVMESESNYYYEPSWMFAPSFMAFNLKLELKNATLPAQLKTQEQPNVCFKVFFYVRVCTVGCLKLVLTT